MLNKLWRKSATFLQSSLFPVRVPEKEALAAKQTNNNRSFRSIWDKILHERTCKKMIDNWAFLECCTIHPLLHPSSPPPLSFLPICWEDMPGQGICQAATTAHLTFVKCTCQRPAISAHTQTQPSRKILVLTLKDNQGGQILLRQN